MKESTAARQGSHASGVMNSERGRLEGERPAQVSAGEHWVKPGETMGQ